MRLIDADALYELLDGGYDLDFDEVPETKRELLRMISAQPTIEERKTGKWEIYVVSPFDGEGCRCSECGFEGVPYWDFCPNCGAQMEVEHETD